MAEATRKTIAKETLDVLEKRFKVTLYMMDERTVAVHFSEPPKQRIDFGNAGLAERADVKLYGELYNELEKLGYVYDYGSARAELISGKDSPLEVTYTFVMFSRKDIKEEADRLRPALDEIRGKYPKIILEMASAKEIKAIFDELDGLGVKLPRNEAAAQKETEKLSEQQWGGVARILRREGYEQVGNGVGVWRRSVLGRKEAYAMVTRFVRKEGMGEAGKKKPEGGIEGNSRS